MDRSKSWIADVSFRNTGDEIIGTLPAIALKHTGDPFYLTLSVFEHTLLVYTKEEWDKLQAKIDSFPLEKQRKLRPITAFARCIHVNEDDGSFVLPARLAEHAQMKEHAVLCYPTAVRPHGFPEGVFLLQSEQT